jgi:hypothetical protein
MNDERIELGGGEWRLWSQFALRGPGFPASGVLRMVPEGLADEAARFTGREMRTAEGWKAFEARFDAAMIDATRTLQEISAQPLFRAAVAWQNRPLLGRAVEPLSRWEPSRGRTSEVRQREELVAHYWQRFCVKNDTIGFFGPVGWGTWDADVRGVEIEPGEQVIAESEVYFSSWAVDTLARHLETDPGLRPWAAPRRVPYLGIGGGTVRMPARPPETVDPVVHTILELCDGVRGVAVLARDASRLTGRDLTAADVTAVLETMVRKRWIVWRHEVPSGPHPDQELRAVLERVGDAAVRERALEKLAVLEHGRERVRAAFGDAGELVAALTALEDDFAAITSTAAQRDKGERTAPCRSLVYSDCRRASTARIGATLLDQLAPLELCLISARWMTARFAESIGARIRDVYERLRERNGTVDLASLWFATLPAPHVDSLAEAERIAGEMRERWARIIDAPPGARRVQLRSPDIAEQVREQFGEPGPSWWLARYFCPDLLIVADSSDAVARGEFELVLGELHSAMNTVAYSLWVMQHPDIKELLDETTVDFPGPRVTPMLPNELPRRWSSRSRMALVRDEDYYVAIVDHTIDPRRPRTAMSADVLVEDRGGNLVVVLPDGAEFDLLDVYGHALSNRVLDKFTLGSDAEHSPRITVDRMVLARETWRFAAGGADMAFAAEKNEARRFVRTARWRRERDLARFVFVVSPTEPRPFYVDFESPIYVNIFTKAVRRLAREKPEASLKISEMLPSPEQTWLTDHHGERYTSELRLIVVAGDRPDGSER